jgi:hypothetical protein
MSSIKAHTLVLTPHSSTASDAVRAVGARVARDPNGILTVTYRVEGDVSRMCVPPPRPPRRADRLWQHTCLEAFVAPDGGPAYRELNFSPSGEWASYAFSAYRTGMAAAEDVETPTIAVMREESGLTVDVSVRLAGLQNGAPANVALAAIIEESSGGFSYWALEHPPGKPDFHHPQGFSLRI